MISIKKRGNDGPIESQSAFHWQPTGHSCDGEKGSPTSRIQLASNYLKVQQGKLRRDNFGGEEGDANGNQKLAINGTGDDESGRPRGRDNKDRK